MLRGIKNIAVTVLVVSTVVLTFIAILSIWDVLANDTFWKSLSTMGVLAFGSAIILITIKYLEDRKSSGGVN